MKKILLAVATVALLVAACSQKTDQVQLVATNGLNGADGSSCSVSQNEVGALLSCTDGSSVQILNGATGAQGLKGDKGDAGADGVSCSVERPSHANYVNISCPGSESSTRVYDGRNGKDGEDGIGCSILSLSSWLLPPAGGALISCGGYQGNIAFIKNGAKGDTGATGAAGSDGKNGKSCTSSKSGSVVTIKCPGSPDVTVADGAQGSTGPQGPIGPAGPQGQSFQPSVGLACQVYDLPGDAGQSRTLPQAFLGAIPKFTVVVSQLNVGDTQSSAGFPFLTSAQKALIGTDGYALDCNGYLAVPTTGTYTFNLMSDDGARLAIEDNEIINNDGLHAPSEKSGSGFLYKGLNRINVQYYQGPNTQIALKLDWAGPNFSRVNIPSTSFSN